MELTLQIYVRPEMHLQRLNAKEEFVEEESLQYTHPMDMQSNH